MKKQRKFKSSVLLCTLTAFAIFILNKFIFFLSCLNENLYSRNSNNYQWRFGKIFYTKQGKGNPILLIHELNHTSSDIEFRAIIDHLASKHTVYTLDLLGCGRSDKPNITYTGYLYVQMITDFIKNIIGSKTDVIATGSSANIAVMACHADPELLGKLLFINPENLSLSSKIPTTRHIILKYFLEMPLIGTLTYNIVASKFQIKRTFEEQYFNSIYKINPKYIWAYHEAAHLQGVSSKHLYSSVKSHYTNVNISHALKIINNSIYIIVGDNEESAKETICQYLELNSSIETSSIEHTKHLPHLESPEAVLAICDIFF